jgi:hypothetical protein
LRGIIGQKEQAFYDEAIAAFVFPADGEDGPETFAAIDEDDRKYYPVGDLLGFGRKQSKNQIR